MDVKQIDRVTQKFRAGTVPSLCPASRVGQRPGAVATFPWPLYGGLQAYTNYNAHTTLITAVNVTWNSMCSFHLIPRDLNFSFSSRYNMTLVAKTVFWVASLISVCNCAAPQT